MKVPDLSLPYRSPSPSARRPRRAIRLLRWTGYILLAVALVIPVVQFQHATMKKVRQGRENEKGAMARWRPAVRAFWAGEDIYARPSEASAVPATQPEGSVISPRAALPVGTSTPTMTAAEAGAVYAYEAGETIYAPPRQITMHPNTPFTVILMTPLAAMPVGTMALTMNVAKIAAILASLWMLATLAAHRKLRICDWVLGLGALWAYHSMLSDIQHANTNIFVLFFIVLHLWLYRRGQDLVAGASLAVAICLKMTPALFVLYWLYQRNWKLLAWTLAAGVVFIVVVPVAAVGMDHYETVMGSWLGNMIIPGLVKGEWFPLHINQSLSGVVSRLFLTGANGDIFYNPEDGGPYGADAKSGFITLVALSPEAVKMLLRVGQVAIVGLMAWGIGWRKLPRDDGRRLLHYGMIALGMMLLNQRTWTHHATVFLIAMVAIWQAIAFGLMRRSVRAPVLWAMFGVAAITWITASDAFHLYAKLVGNTEEFMLGSKTLSMGELWSDYADAYGPQFWVFVLLLLISVALARALRKGPSPYAAQRQKLSATPPS